MVGRLLMSAVADSSASVRRAVLKAFLLNEDLDEYLSQADWCESALAFGVH